MIKIFADLHHQSLFTSLQFLFEGRLGGQLFRPIGVQWANEGFWEIARPYGNDPRTISQFLGIRDEVKMETPPLNDIETEGKEHYVTKNVPINHKAVTLEQFKAMKFDILIASIPAHIKPYSELIKQFQPQAKLIFQIGNHFGPIDFDLAKNIMSSTAPFSVPTGTNKVFYHQEFDLNMFSYTPPSNTKNINSFVHCLKEKPADYHDYIEYKRLMPDFEFRSYGASCDDGCAQGEIEVAAGMKNSGFGFHLKDGGDGYGHVLFNWFACGRPVIVRKSQYKNKLADKLMIDGKTCIDLDKGNVEKNIKRIRECSEPERHTKMCEAAHKRFKDTVDFEQDARKIKKFIERLV